MLWNLLTILIFLVFKVKYTKDLQKKKGNIKNVSKKFKKNNFFLKKVLNQMF
jgi:hypothetical protein